VVHLSCFRGLTQTNSSNLQVSELTPELDEVNEATAECLLMAHAVSIERLREAENASIGSSSKETRTDTMTSMDVFDTEPRGSSITLPTQYSIPGSSKGGHDDTIASHERPNAAKKDSDVLEEAVSVSSPLKAVSVESLRSISSVKSILLADKWTQPRETVSVSTRSSSLPQEKIRGQPSSRTMNTPTRRTVVIADVPPPANVGAKVQNGPGGQKQRTSFPHAFERWESLSMEWEGLTSHWIQRMERHSAQYADDPIVKQLATQVQDLSAAGSNLFYAVVELQRLRASSERKFQRWFFETRSDIERVQETNTKFEATVEELQAQLGDQNNALEQLTELLKTTDLNLQEQSQIAAESLKAQERTQEELETLQQQGSRAAELEANLRRERTRALQERQNNLNLKQNFNEKMRVSAAIEEKLRDDIRKEVAEAENLRREIQSLKDRIGNLDIQTETAKAEFERSLKSLQEEIEKEVDKRQKVEKQLDQETERRQTVLRFLSDDGPPIGQAA
jgi:hypothetical protein